MNRLGKFEDLIVREDTIFFLKIGLITKREHNKIFAWLRGTEDSEIRQIVIDRMEADALYGDRIQKGAMIKFWYIAPFVWIGLRLICRVLRERAKILKAEVGG